VIKRGEESRIIGAGLRNAWSSGRNGTPRCRSKRVLENKKKGGGKKRERKQPIKIPYEPKETPASAKRKGGDDCENKSNLITRKGKGNKVSKGKLGRARRKTPHRSAADLRKVLQGSTREGRGNSTFSTKCRGSPLAEDGF